MSIATVRIAPRISVTTLEYHVAGDRVPEGPGYLLPERPLEPARYT